jgi:hypothetical protein
MLLQNVGWFSAAYKPLFISDKIEQFIRNGSHLTCFFLPPQGKYHVFIGEKHWSTRKNSMFRKFQALYNLYISLQFGFLVYFCGDGEDGFHCTKLAAF